MIVGISTPTLVGGDAVGNDVMGMYYALLYHGHKVRLFANHYDVNATVEPLTRLDNNMDVLIYHHSINCPLGIQALQKGKYQKVIKYHNITPPEFFIGDEKTKKECELGLEQNHEIVKHNVWSDSHYNASQLKAIKPDLEYSVIPPFTQAEDLGAVEANFQAAIPYDDWLTNIIMVGRVAANKDVMMGIRAFEEYLKINRFARLIIIGDKSTDYANSVIDYAKKFGDKVVMTGRVTLSTLKAFYLIADALLITSLHEGFCVPLIEAMSLNVPVVVNDKCALPETAGDAAIVIKGNDPKSFADGLHQTIDSITYVKAGKDHYREKFHRSAVAKTFITAFEAVR